MNKQKTEKKEVNSRVEELEDVNLQDMAHKLSATGWALFFIWIGIAFLAKFSVAVGMLGIGCITLGMQATRKQFKLQLEWFWIVVGILFFVGGLWELFKMDISLVPFILILGGIVLLISIFRGKRHLGPMA